MINLLPAKFGLVKQHRQVTQHSAYMDAQLPVNTSGFRNENLKYVNQDKSIIETVSNGFFTIDRKWTVQYLNGAAEKLLGVKAENIIGKNLWQDFTEVLPSGFYKVYHKAFLENVPVHNVEYWNEMGDWFDVISYHSGDSLSISFKSSNHSGHPQQPEEQLEILTELYRYVTEVTNDCLWEWDLQTAEMFWIDGGHQRIFGYQIVNALMPQSFWESCIHPDDKVRILTRLNKMVKEGTAVKWDDKYRFKKENGEYVYVHDRGHFIYEGEKITRIIGATQDITETVLLEKKLLEERESKQSEMTDAMLTAQENERSDIGKELHDNLNQILAVAKMYIQMAKTKAKDRDLYLDKSYGFIVDVIEEIRKISKHLVIPGLHIFSLTDNIKNLIDDLQTVDPIQIDFHEKGINEEILNQKLQLSIFRIVQEQVNNILKHAKASYATIDLCRKGNEIMLLISDDGDGCDVVEKKKGVGIINIKSRAELYGGKVSVITRPNEGYVLKVVIPVSSPGMILEQSLTD